MEVDCTYFCLQVMISGSKIQMGIQWESIGYKVYIWFTVHITACGWGRSYNLIWICSNQTIFVPNSMQDQGPFVVVQCMWVIQWAVTILI